jgi:hypothetical protein
MNCPENPHCEEFHKLREEISYLKSVIDVILTETIKDYWQSRQEFIQTLCEDSLK